MTVTTTVYETAARRTPDGGTLVLRLLVSAANSRTEIRIDCERRLPHKVLESIVLKIDQPTHGIEPLARAMTTITHELDRLHRQGYALRECAAGGFRGAWHADLVSPHDSRVAVSWEINLRRPTKNLELLAGRLAALDLPAPTLFESRHDTDVLVTAMIDHGDEVRRHHAIDAIIAADPSMPADEFLEELEGRGLLSPTDPEDADL